MSDSISYTDAGVSIDAANETTARIKEMACKTFNARTLTEIGSFGGMFDAKFPEMQQPILVSSADGVGTKLKVAFLANVHNTIGQDLVNHCINDILVQGARPLFFMDYFATGKLAPETAAEVIGGIAKACRENDCVLLGGETAEMPGMYSAGEYDLAGFIVGIVDKERVIDGKNIKPGDAVLGLPSKGLHTNGYSLARKLLFETAGYSISTVLGEVLDNTIGNVLLEKHKCYFKPLAGLLDSGIIKGLAHITGGGLLENIPRILPENVGVEIRRGTWNELPIFGLLQEIGKVSDVEMFRTFNMGVGMVAICDPNDVDEIKAHLAEQGETCSEIGCVVSGNQEVIIKQVKSI